MVWELTKQRHSSGGPSVPDLNNAIQEYLDAWNEDPKPFVYTANRGIDSGETVLLPADVGED